MKLNYRKTSITIVILYTLTGINAMYSWQQQQTWTYELKSFEATTNNPDLMNFSDMKADRIARGIFAASGSFTINFDIGEDDATEVNMEVQFMVILCMNVTSTFKNWKFQVEFNTYRSESGVRDFYLTPFSVQRQHIYEYINTFYKDYVMETLSKCSNLPVFEDTFEPPLEKKKYTLDKCQFNQDVFPQHLQDGFYKLVVTGYGVVEWSLIFIVEVQNKPY